MLRSFLLYYGIYVHYIYSLLLLYKIYTSYNIYYA